MGDEIRAQGESCPGEASESPAEPDPARPRGSPVTRHRWWLSRRNGWTLAALIPLCSGVIVMSPLGRGAIQLDPQLKADARAASRNPALTLTIPAKGRSFTGTPPVGALFTTTRRGTLGRHFCTASVVDSPPRDVLVTAAHCVSGRDRGPIAFVPGFHDGQTPYGVWRVTRIVVDHDWASSRNPDDDFAFLVVAGRDGRKVQDVTGGERLGRSLGVPDDQLVQVVGYPDGGQVPIVCVNRELDFSPSQLQFDCGGYTDGTSGGPLLDDVSPVTGLGTVVGVIGGYEQGGRIPAVSYAARFGPSVAALYETAVRDS
jgi:V8-like Glu-specific endopeptidase